MSIHENEFDIDVNKSLDKRIMSGLRPNVTLTSYGSFMWILKQNPFIYLFKQCLKRMTQLAINSYSTLWSSN